MTNTSTNTALLVMDVQPGIVTRMENQEEYVEEVKGVVAAAHRHQLPVIYVVVGFRPGFPEVNPHNKSFGAMDKAARAPMVNPQPVIEPGEDDVVVVKRRISAFSGSDLEVVLRAKGISHLVLAGISTSGVVLSTTREAADKDYQLTILSDLCIDFDPEVGKVLLEKVFPRQADVITSNEWTEAL